MESPEVDYLAAAAANSVNYLEIAAAIVEDVQFLLAWGTGAATMTAKDSPDESGLQFPTGSGSNAYVTSLLDWFGGNPFIDRDFVLTTNFTGAHPRIIFTAKSPGPNYNFTAGASTGVITPGVTDQPVDNFCHNVQLFITLPGKAAAQAYAANVPLDRLGTGQTTMDIHREVDAFLKPDVPVLSSLVAQCTLSTAQLLIKYAQFKGADPSIRRVYKSVIFYLNKGGLGMQPNLVRSLVTELCPVDGDGSQNRFLRQGSKNKLVTKDQPEWLAWLNLTGALVTVSLEITIYNDDDTSHTFNVAPGTVIGAYEKFQFKAGYNQINITGQQAIDKLPLYYTARIKAAAGYLTDIYAFVVDNQYRQWPRYIVYYNSYGGFNTIATVGKASPEVDRSADLVQLAVNGNQAALNGEFIEANIFIQGKGTINIGYDRSNARTTDLLNDLFLSQAIYQYDAGTLIPIGLNTKNFKFPTDGTNVFAGTIEYFIKYNEETFTEDLPIADDTVPQLLGEAGTPVGVPGTEPLPEGDHITVQFDDIHLSMDGGQQVYSAPVWLAGLTNYQINSTQLGQFLRAEDIAYNIAGSFKILVPGFILNEGDQLIIWPFNLNPDSL